MVGAEKSLERGSDFALKTQTPNKNNQSQKKKKKKWFAK